LELKLTHEIIIRQGMFRVRDHDLTKRAMFRGLVLLDRTLDSSIFGSEAVEV